MIPAIAERPAPSGLCPADDIMVRPADVSDWPRIWPIWKRIVECGETHPYPIESTEQDAVSLWLAPKRSAIYVAEQAGTVVAAMMTKPMRYGNGDHVANFDLMVDPACRGLSVGRKLSTYVIEATRRAGYFAMEAYAVVETNIASVRLWRSHGFEIVGTVPGAFRHPIHGLAAVHHMYKVL